MCAVGTTSCSGGAIACGDPNDADFAFCGRGSMAGPYCSDHARLAYQPSQAKKKRVSEPDELRRMLRVASF